MRPPTSMAEVGGLLRAPMATRFAGLSLVNARKLRVDQAKPCWEWGDQVHGRIQAHPRRAGTPEPDRCALVSLVDSSRLRR